MSDTSASAGSRWPAWRSADVLRAAMVIVAVYAAARLLWLSRALVLTAFLGVLFGIAVAAGAEQLQRLRIPRAVGAPFIVLTFLVALGGFGTWIGPTVRDQTTELRTKLPEALDKIDQWVSSQGGGIIATVLGFEKRPSGGAATGAPTAITGSSAPGRIEIQQEQRVSLRERIMQQLGGTRRFFLPVLSSTLVVLAGIVLVIFLAIYVAIDPGTYKRGALALVPTRSRDRVDRTLVAIATTLRRWLTTQLVAMVVIGTVTTIVLLALRVRAAVPLGILAGLLEFVPTIGPILSAVPAIAMGFVDSPEKALWVALAYVGIQFLENHWLIPVLMKEGIGLPPALTIVTQALMALVFGFLGLLVAVPLLATVVVAVRSARFGEPVPVPATPAQAPPNGTS